MKRLIVCCDGTWNNAEQEQNGIPAPTNVLKIFNAVSEGDPDEKIKQLKYYHPGVGGEGGLIDKVAGGAIGAGISRNICSAYHWLGLNYEEGDAIYLFGFSRGAFTARSLGGLLGKGLLKLADLNSRESWHRVHTAYDQGYRVTNATIADWAQSDWQFFHDGQPTPIRFIGVWDTVGALGVPDDLELFNILDDREKWQFHSTELGAHVKTARHAMAIDEVRSSFSITRWSNASEHPDALELWFPGAHCDVGGGYSVCDLSDGALLWMMEESGRAELKFRQGATTTLKPNPLGVMHNSYKGVFAKFRSRPRNLDAMVDANKARFHSSALERQRVSPIAYPPYHPTRILEVTDEPFEVDVFADTQWNYTGVYLPAGHAFLFSATGEWQDGKDTCDWKGTEDASLTIGDIFRGASTFLGKSEDFVKRITRNQSTDLLGTKRVEQFKWFTMVGAITNDGASSAAVTNDGSPVPHQYVDLTAHEKEPFVVTAPGYLYCFANDVWSLYENNRGSVRLSIRRVS